MSLTIRWTSITLKGVNTYAITYFVLKCFFLKKKCIPIYTVYRIID